MNEHYNVNNMSPLEAYRRGLLSRDEYVGFIKGNIIKYVLRCEYKDDAFGDLNKAIDYIKEYYYVIGSEKLGIDIEEYRELSILNGALGELDG